METDTLSELIDELVDQTPTVVNFEPDDETVFRLLNDLGMQLHDNAIIAGRYGLTLQQLLDWLRQPGVLRRAKQRKAWFQSEAGIVERNRACFGLMTLDAATVLDGILHNRNAPANIVLDAFKVVTKLAGLEATPRLVEGAGGGPQGATFAVNFHFSGGRTESIQLTPPPPTIEGEAA